MHLPGPVGHPDDGMEGRAAHGAPDARERVGEHIMHPRVS
jgi:hypothetical protein